MEFNILKEQELLEVVSEHDIFNFVLQRNVPLNTPIHSPLRVDHNPSFNIFEATQGSNKLMWKDFSTGESGNCFKLVSLMYNLNYIEAIRWVNRNMGIGLIDSMIKLQGNGVRRDCVKKDNLIYKPIPSESIKESKTNFNFVYRYWTKADYAYWEQYHIQPLTLDTYGVNAVDQVWVNNKFAFRSIKTEPIYNYIFVDEINSEYRYKVYRPFNVKHSKWLSNCNDNVLPGYIQLKNLRLAGYDLGSFCFITKSYKDNMVFTELGYPCVSSNSENSIIKPIHFRNLINLGFTEFVVVFDNDGAGRKAAMKYNELYNIPAFEIDETLGVKDISEFIQQYGKQEATQLANVFSSYKNTIQF